jgi:hypothetical protein
VGMVLANTAGFSVTRSLLAGGTGDLGEDATALLENGERGETNDNSFEEQHAAMARRSR